MTRWAGARRIAGDRGQALRAAVFAPFPLPPGGVTLALSGQAA